MMREVKKMCEFIFTGLLPGQGMMTRQYARLLSEWLTRVGLDPHLYGTHSLRRTKATLIYRAPGICGLSSYFLVTPRSKAQ